MALLNKEKADFNGTPVKVKPFKSLDDLERADVVVMEDSCGFCSYAIFEKFDRERFIFIQGLFNRDFWEYRFKREEVDEEHSLGRLRITSTWYPNNANGYRNPTPEQFYPKRPILYEYYPDPKASLAVYKGRYEELQKLVEDAIEKGRLNPLEVGK